jgi:seryl-tRNA synthetase
MKKGIIFLAFLALVAFVFTSCEPEWRKSLAPLEENLKTLEAQAEKVKSGDVNAIKDAKALIATINTTKDTLTTGENATDESKKAWADLTAKYAQAETLLKSESLDDFKILSDAKAVIETLRQPAKDFMAAYTAYKGGDRAAGAKVQALGKQLQAAYDKFQSLESKLTISGSNAYKDLKNKFFADNPGLLQAMQGK